MTQSDDTIDRRCSICGRHKNDVKALFDTGRGILICDRCIKGLLNQILAERTGQSIETIARDTDRDNYMSPAAALEYGLIDKIFDKREVKPA